MQNAFVVIASYIFYGWWDWRFLCLIALTSICSWGSGMLIAQRNRIGVDCHRKEQNVLFTNKFWLVVNIVINLGILAIFKYYDFFISSFGQLFGLDTECLLLRVILPVGISFYTFQALSYSIDVYRKKIEPTKDIIAFFAFISFFPQLVAGPIERATNLLPQFQKNRKFNYDQAIAGLWQILWGLFKKIVVADNCAAYVNQVWSTHDTHTGSTLLLAAILFTFQIYGDFSGYSDIAIGTAKLFGINLKRNFNNPYFSRDVAEFWRRWHISLTTWFKDYVYIPLGGSRPEIPTTVANPSRYKKWIIVRNTFVIFLLSGFWHGANWTFIAWGAYHAFLFLPLILLGKNRTYTNQIAEGRFLPTWLEAARIVLTFGLVVLGWIIFRSETITQSWEILSGISDVSLFSKPNLLDKGNTIVCCIAIFILLIVEWLDRNSDSPLYNLRKIYVFQNKYSRIVTYVLFLFLSLAMRGGAVDFIYFQF